MRVIEQLWEEHRVLAAQGERMLRIVGSPIPDAASVAMLRWRMAEALARHCTREDSYLYARLIGSGDAQATAHAWEMRKWHEGLAENFWRYVGDWPVARVANEWDEFGEETRTIIAALHARIEAEEGGLYAHARRVIGRRAA